MATEDILEELEESLRYDDNSLDEASQQHAELYYRVAKMLAMEISRRDAAKQALDESKARADVALRADFRASGEKFTEKELDSLVRTDKRVLAAYAALHEKEELVGRLSALEKSFVQRSHALRNSIDLYLRAYYGDPASRPSRNELRERHGQEGREAMARERRNREERVR